MRPPVVEAEGEQVEEATIYVGLAERLGMIPGLPSKLRELAGDRPRFGVAFMEYIRGNPKAAPWLPYILAKTLGEELGSKNLATLWGLLARFPMMHSEEVARAGYQVGPDTGEEIFRKILNTPGGVKIGVVDTENNFSRLETPDKKIHIHFPEMESWVKEVQPGRRRDPADQQGLPHGSYGWKPHGDGGQHDHARPGLERGKTSLHYADTFRRRRRTWN